MSTGAIRKLSSRGDTATLWDTEMPDTVDLARLTFESERAAGNIAYSRDSVIRAFDPEAGEILIISPLKGG